MQKWVPKVCMEAPHEPLAKGWAMHTAVRLYKISQRAVAMELKMEQEISGEAMVGNVGLQAQPEWRELDKTDGVQLRWQKGNILVVKNTFKKKV